MKLIFYSADLSTELELPLAEQSIRAGFPSPAQDYLTDSIDLNRELKSIIFADKIIILLFCLQR